jgi:hypothetical protein
VPPHRDLTAYDDRAPEYDHGWRGRLHHEISQRTADLAVATNGSAAPQMIATAGAFEREDRLSFTVSVAEELGYPGGTFDLVVSTTSFDHWTD